MFSSDRLDELLDHWEDQRQSGVDLAVEELCPDDPLLQQELQKRIEMLRSMDSILAGDTIPTPVPRSNAIPQVDTGRYKLLRFHAAGGLGQIFLARDSELQRDVALKLIHARHAKNKPSRERFEMEAEITGRLEHPGIVPVYGFGIDRKGQPFYAMRYIRGETLGAAIERFHAADLPRGERGLQLQKLLRQFLSVCQTVAYAHSREIVHRDLKPGNIMLGKFGETLVVDWGLAKPFAAPEIMGESSEGSLRPQTALISGQTLAGEAKGSPVYMSPEQAAGRLQEVGAASDIYSLGATLYLLLTGQRPFTGTSLDEILEKVKAGDFPRPRIHKPNLPAPLEAICLRAMAKRPENRYRSALDLAADIEHWLADEPVEAYSEPWRLRAGRWMRRHRTAMSTVAAAMIVAIVMLGGATAFLNEAWGQAEARRQDAEHQKTIANDQKQKADQQAELARDAQQLAEEQAALAQQQKLLAEKAADLARRAEAEATRLAQVEREQREQVEQNLYRSLILLADREIQGNNVSRAQELLEEAPAALRGWEWHHLQRSMQGNLLTLDAAHAKTIYDAVFSPDGEIVATVGGGEWEEPGEIKLWDARRGTLLKTLKGHEQIVWRVDFHPDGKQLVSTARDGTIKLWSIEDGTVLHTFESPSGLPWGIAFNPEGTRLAVGGQKEVHVWNLESKELIYTVGGHSGTVYDVAFSKTTNRLASCSSTWDGGPFGEQDKPSEGEVKIWDATTGEALRTLGGQPAQEVGCLDFSPDGTRLAGSDRGPSFATQSPTGVKVWDVETGELVQTLNGHGDRLQAVAFHPNGKQLASGGDDRTIRIWDLESGRSLFALRGHTGQISRLAYSADGHRLVSAGDYDNTARIWDAESPVAVRTLGGENMASDDWVSFSPDSRLVATVDSEGIVQISDPETGELLQTIQVPGLRAARAIFHPLDKELLAISGHREKIAFCSPRTGEVLGTFDAPDDVQEFAFSADGKRFAIGSWTQETRFYDTATRQQIVSPIEGLERAAHDLVFSSDGRRFATCGENRVRIWDLVEGKLVSEQANLNVDDVLAFSPDGRLLASGGSEAYTQVWNGLTGEPVLQLKRHDGSWIHGISFHRDGTRVATGGMDGNIKLWDVQTGRELLSIRQAGPFPVGHVFFSPNGRWLAARAGGKIVLWDGLPLNGETAPLPRTVPAQTWNNTGKQPEPRPIAPE